MEKSIESVENINIRSTPIVFYLRERIEDIDDLIRYFTRWTPIIRSRTYKSKRRLNLKNILFYETVRYLAVEISNDYRFDKAVPIKPLDKFETCVICGMRAIQRELKLKPNLNHVKYLLVQRTLMQD